MKKQYIAAFLAVLAILSYVVGAGLDAEKTEQVAGIMTAIAKEDAGTYEMFLKVDTIPGDSADGKHRNEIVVDSFAWGETRDRGAGKATMNAFTVTMPVSSASAKLFLAGAAGSKIIKVTLSVRRRGAQQDFLKWTLTDTQVTSFQTVGNTYGDGVSDKVSFGFGKIEAEYRVTMPDGSLGTPVKAGWDQRTGKST